MQNIHPMLNTAMKAARVAGNIITRGASRLHELNIEAKTPNDFVSEIDQNAELAIKQVLLEAYPDHGIHAEEFGIDGNADADHIWIIDPLDGTTNFLHGFPHYAVSIALQVKDVLEQAVIYNPATDEMFIASKGQGAYLNNRRIRVSTRTGIDGALFATGIPFSSVEKYNEWLPTMEALLHGSAGMRRAGSAALDCAYTASGRVDAFWEFHLQPWDIAAGALIVREAGGLVTDFNGEANYLRNGNILVANPKLFNVVLKKIQNVI